VGPRLAPQTLRRILRRGEQFMVSDEAAVAFVPLVRQDKQASER
jgi:hypothetical protein